eukprot:GHVQ01029754.1.p1 GENE.GHVQ01029754.1~~GHVQ01029754.1.p1  ORF type:complete len:101 (+),score=11.55 GHVQ01029754.1:340-642(+)
MFVFSAYCSGCVRGSRDGRPASWSDRAVPRRFCGGHRHSPGKEEIIAKLFYIKFSSLFFMTLHTADLLLYECFNLKFTMIHDTHNHKSTHRQTQNKIDQP